jgi:L-lactate dehydrogenase complex protein LldE
MAASRVALFVTCLADTLFPEVGKATVVLLERLGVQVVFPREQTCCGQLHLNSGYVNEARTLGRRFGEVFSGFETIVTPSGSCAAHVRHHAARLAAETAEVAGRVLELSEYLAREAPDAGRGARFPHRVAYHPTCHSLRLLELGERPASLLARVEGLELVTLTRAEECCGFGGTFAVKNASVSSAILQEKIDSIVASGAEAVCACDASCLMHIGGGLRRRGVPVRAVHLAEVLAS